MAGNEELLKKLSSLEIENKTLKKGKWKSGDSNYWTETIIWGEPYMYLFN